MIKVFILLFFILGFPGSINSQYHAVYIPSDKLAKIKIDGNTDDWDWVPQKYFITGAEMNSNYLISKATYNKKNWDCKILVAWNDVTNRIYIVVTVFDDAKRSNPESLFDYPNLFDDNLQVIVNPNDISGDCWNKYAYIDKYNLVKFTMHIPFSNGKAKLIYEYGPSWFSSHNELISYDWKNKGDCSNGSCETTYELEMVLWDKWSDLGIEYSSRHILSSGQNIRLAVVIDDVDKSKNKIDDEWMICYQPYWLCMIIGMPEFIMDPSLESEDPWPGIKSVLEP